MTVPHYSSSYQPKWATRAFELTQLQCCSNQHSHPADNVCLVAWQGIEPEIRTYNTVIIACNMSGQATEALKVYERMLRAGADPTATTYTALISAYGKNGQLDRAMQIFEDMVGISCSNRTQSHS